MKLSQIDFHIYNITAVIPCYRVDKEIAQVLAGLPSYLRHIIVVDDASPDHTADIVAQVAKTDLRIVLIKHDRNQGVGSAMKTGFQKALELGTQIIVKVDGDGQMDSAYLPDLLVLQIYFLYSHN